MHRCRKRQCRVKLNQIQTMIWAVDGTLVDIRHDPGNAKSIMIHDRCHRKAYIHNLRLFLLFQL